MLGLLRKNSKHWLVLTIVAVAAFGMAFFFGSSQNKGEISSWAAKVDGETISFNAFNNVYTMQMNKFRSQFPDLDEKFLQNLNLKQRVLSNLVMNKLLAISSYKNGFIVSDEELKDKIITTPIFQREGRFDLDYYKGFLAYSGYSSSEFEKSLKEDLLSSKFKEFINASVEISEDEYKLSYLLDKEKISIKFSELLIDPKLYEINDLKVKEFLNTEAGLKEAQDFYTKNNDNYKEQEKLRARHILIKFSSEDSLDLRNEKKKKIEEVQALVSPENFSDMAKKYSEDSSASQGGDLSYFSRGAMVKPFEDAVFSLAVGKISNIVETQFGYHLIFLEDKKPERVIMFDEVKENIAKNILFEKEKKKVKESILAKITSEKNINKAFLLNSNKIEHSESFSRSASSIKGLDELTPQDIEWFFTFEPNKIYYKELGSKSYILAIDKLDKPLLDTENLEFKTFKEKYKEDRVNDFFAKYTDDLREKYNKKIKYSPLFGAEQEVENIN